MGKGNRKNAISQINLHAGNFKRSNRTRGLIRTCTTFRISVVSATISVKNSQPLSLQLCKADLKWTEQQPEKEIKNSRMQAGAADGAASGVSERKRHPSCDSQLGCDAALVATNSDECRRGTMGKGN
jgi:hypothetical protein